MTETPSAQERFLTDFHNQNAGVTARAYAPLAATMGQQAYPSTYECLVSVVPAAVEATTVLDLACGDGWLLSLLARREQAAHTLIGIDMSQGELMAARSRLGDTVTLHLGRAQSLPLPDKSVDYVLCHMALMLMDQLDNVLSEVARVLKDNAVFAFVIGARAPAGAALDRYVSRLLEARQNHASAALSLGDSRLRAQQGILDALRPRFDSIVIDEITLRRRYTPTELWAWLEDLYDLHFMPLAPRLELRDAYLLDLETLVEDDGKLEFTDTLRRVTAVVTKAHPPSSLE